jgi:hypothetical protein
MKKPILTLDEHRALGLALVKLYFAIFITFGAGKYKKSSPTNRRVQSLIRTTSMLRNALQELMYRQNPEVSTGRERPVIYFGHEDLPNTERQTEAGLIETFSRDVASIIDGRKTSKRVTSLCLKINCLLHALNAADLQSDEYRRRS